MASRSSVVLGIVAVAAIVAAARTGGLDFMGGSVAAIVLAAVVGALTFAPGSPRARAGRARDRIADGKGAADQVPTAAGSPPADGDVERGPASRAARATHARAGGDAVAGLQDTSSAGSPRAFDTPAHGVPIRTTAWADGDTDHAHRVPAVEAPFDERRMRDRRVATRRSSSSGAKPRAQSPFGPRDDWSLEDTGESRAVRASTVDDARLEQHAGRSEQARRPDTARRPERKHSARRDERVATAERVVIERRLARDLSGLGAEVRRAIDLGELELQYQPVVDFRTGSVVAFEALVRWRHPDHGIVWPDELIPAAEREGAMDAVTGWVVREACRQAAEWRDRGGVEPVPIAVNLDGHSVAFGDVVWTVRDAMERVSLSPDLLRIEVKESTLSRPDASPSALAALAGLGVGLHLDDYGTGASSVARLREYGVVALKVDRSFVARMHDDAASSQVVGAMVSLAHNLGMKAIAEGVQTPAQFEGLRDLGCDYGQGYLFSRPLDPAYARALLTDDARWD